MELTAPGAALQGALNRAACSDRRSENEERRFFDRARLHRAGAPPAAKKRHRITRMGSVAGTLLLLAIGTTNPQSQSSGAADLKNPPLGKSRGWFAAGPSEPGIWSNITAHQGGTIYVASMGGGVRKSTDFGATWTTVNNGLPAGANSFAMDASGPDTVYCGILSVVTGVPTGVYKSTDGGKSWAHMAGTTNNVAISLEADPTTPGVVFMGALGGALRRTTDGGATWSVVFTGTSPIGSIQVDPTDGQRVYMATLAATWRSLDAGTTWSHMSGLTAPNVWGLGIDPTEPGVLYAATNAHGIWKSVDYGDSWTNVSPALTAYNVAVDPTNSSYVYAATRNAVWMSTDAGSTWHESGLAGRGAFSINVEAGVVYVGTASGAATSRDRGASWSDLDPGLGGARAFGYAVTLDPNTRNKVFVSALNGTVTISQDGGGSWVPSHAGFLSKSARAVAVDPADPSRVYAGSFPAGGLFKSLDGGTSWQRRTFGSAAIYVWQPAVDPIEPRVVYAGTQGDGLWKSIDYGDTWMRLPGLPAIVQGAAIDPIDSQRVFASTPTGVWRSENGGQTWTNVLTTPAWNVTFTPGSSVAYATSRQAGVFKSLDRGNTWFPINNGITNLVMGRSAPVAVHPEDTDTIYAASEAGGGVYKSKDGGANWRPVNLHLADTSVYGLVMDPFRPKTLYVSTPSGVYKTLSGGE